MMLYMTVRITLPVESEPAITLENVQARGALLFLNDGILQTGKGMTEGLSTMTEQLGLQLASPEIEIACPFFHLTAKRE